MHAANEAGLLASLFLSRAFGTCAETKEALQRHCEPRIGVKQSQFSIKKDRSNAVLF
jgi:hypothetical protein